MNRERFTLSCTYATMSGKEGIGFVPSFSELLEVRHLSALCASADTSSLLHTPRHFYFDVNTASNGTVFHKDYKEMQALHDD